VFGLLALISLAQAAAAAEPAQAPPWPTVAPDGVTVTPDWSDWRIYPTAAQRKNEEGSVRAELLVGADGRPEECRILKTSNFPDLDTGTCQLMMQMRFKAAHDVKGVAVPSTYSRDVVWLLIDARPFGSSALKVRASIRGGGQTSCEVVGGEGPYVIAWSALVCPLLMDVPYFFGEHADRSADVTVEFRLDAGDHSPVLDQPLEAAPVIASEKLSFVVDSSGDPSMCVPIERSGFGPRDPTETSPCPTLLRILWFEPSKAGQPTRKGVFETSVYLVSEQPGS
jgi:TonB family protein